MSRTEKQPNNLNRRLLIGLVFGFIVVLAMLFIGDVRKTGELVFSFQWKLLPLVIGLTLTNYFLRFQKWHFYIGQIGVRDYPRRKSARLFVAGFPLALTPAKVGEALKGVWLNRECAVPTAAGIAIVAAERISDGLAVIVLSTLGVIAYPAFWPAFAAALLVLLGIVIVSQIKPLAFWLLDLLVRLPLAGRFARSLREFYEGSYVLFRPRAALLAISLGSVAWLCEGIGFFLILVGLGQEPSLRLLANAVFILAFSTLVGGLSTLPGGLGAVEASIAGMLALLAGLDAATAAAATLLIRFATIWFGTLLGLVVWSFSPDLLGLEMRASFDKYEVEQRESF